MQNIDENSIHFLVLKKGRSRVSIDKREREREREREINKLYHKSCTLLVFYLFLFI